MSTLQRKALPSGLLRRGLVSIGIAGAIQALIGAGIASPWPDRTSAQVACALVALWGAVDLLRHTARRFGTPTV